MTDTLFFETKEEIEHVLDAMNEVIRGHEHVSVNDLNMLIGYRGTYKNSNIGWDNLTDVKIEQIDNGFLVKFPPMKQIA